MLKSITDAFLKLETKQNQIKAVFISTANNIHNPDFLAASTKENSEIVCLHFIVRNQSHLKQISDLANRYQARVFLDCEKKGAYDDLVADYSAISTAFFQLKPNEFSAKTIDSIVETQKKSPSPSCLLIGMGDLGLKTAFFLANRNCHLVLTSRDLNKANALVTFLTTLSRTASVQTASHRYLDNWEKSSFDFVIASSAGTPVVHPSHLDLLKKGGMILDAGTGCIAPETIALANTTGVKIYSLYSGDMLLSEIGTLLATGRRYNSLQRKTLADGTVLISAGIVGAHGDVVVDNVENPTRYIAVCDGKGGILPQEIAITFIRNKELKR